MLRPTIALLAALALALAACDNDEESIPDATSPTPTTIAGAITICPRIGVPGEATPASPTPEPSCEPGDDFTQVAPNIRGRLTEAPPLPPGLVALTRYLEFETDTPDIAVQISVPLDGELPIGRNPAWYSYESGQWQPLDVTPTIHQSTDRDQLAMASGSFDPLPPNLILLAVQ